MSHRMPAVALLAALCCVGCRLDAQPAAGPPVGVDELRLAFYDYDHSLPLNPKLRLLPDKSNALAALRTRYHLVYDSVHDQRVTAIVAIPRKFAPPYPFVVLLAGSGGHKDTDYVRISSDLLCNHGFATISIDAQYHGERTRPGRTGDIHLLNSVTNRDAWVQTVIDLRRAVDYMRSRRDTDPKRAGYLGFSQGGMIGGTLLGVEPRLACACLAVPGAGFVEWSKTIDPPIWTAASARTIEVNAAITDPIYFIGRFAPRPLLVLSARRDELIPRAATEALLAAAREPKQVVWFNSGHVLPPTALMINARDFFTEHLGKRAPRSPAAAR